MKRPINLFFLSLFMMLFFVSCLGSNEPKRKVEYYSLEYDPPIIETWEPLSAVIRIDQFRMAPIYNSNRIFFSERSYQSDEYYYHKWRAAPGDLVTYFLSRDLKASSLFKAVFSNDSTSLSSHVIEGMVEEFFEQDIGDRQEAILTVSISLLAENKLNINGGVLLQKRYSVKEKCRRRHPRALAEAMSKAMAEVSGMIITDVYNALSDKEK